MPRERGKPLTPAEIMRNSRRRLGLRTVQISREADAALESLCERSGETKRAAASRAIIETAKIEGESNQ